MLMSIQPSLKVTFTVSEASLCEKGANFPTEPGSNNKMLTSINNALWS